jgi:riboflavin kinase/FMN adenylyltransferase
MPSVKYISLQTEQSSVVSEANILCLGNFDGVHFAHRTLLREAKKMQAEKLTQAKCGVLCFARPSADFLSSNPPKHLTTLEQKLNRFADEGMDFAFVVDFESVKDLSPEEFVNDILIAQCGCKGAVCGYNYRFGKRGAGTPELLQKLLTPNPVITVPSIYVDGDTVSSTRIRGLLNQGNVKEANALLTVPYSITARVEHGKGLGHKLGSPTFNQTPPAEVLIPARGVYLTRSVMEGKSYYGVTNIGIRPTVDTDAQINLETHLLDFSGDLYQKELTVEFLDYIRPEQQFEGIDALQKQIQKDIQTAKERI